MAGFKIFDEPQRKLSPWLLWPLRVLALLALLAIWLVEAILPGSPPIFPDPASAVEVEQGQ
jgi:hypothetical protein